MRKLSIAYIGTPDFSASFLEKMLQNKNLPVDVKFVVTQPDKPVGKKRILTPPPVKVIAEKYHIPVRFTINDVEFTDIDLVLVYAYGEIIPAEFLQQPRYGFVNIHPSLLPKFRGPSPIAYPILLGEKQTGVTLMKMDEKIDHGEMLAQQEIAILATEMRQDLEKKLTDLSYKMVFQFVNSLIHNEKIINPIEQDHTAATFTKLLKKDSGYIPFSTLKKALNAEILTENEISELFNRFSKNAIIVRKKDSSTIVYNLYRALSPWPGIWTTILLEKNEEKRLKLIDISLENHHLVIKKVQLEGKNVVDFPTFTRAYPIF